MRTIAALSGTLVQSREATTTTTPQRRGSWSAWLARRETALFVLLLVVQLVPVWAFTYLPTTDGAAHLERRIVIAENRRMKRRSGAGAQCGHGERQIGFGVLSRV